MVSLRVVTNKSANISWDYFFKIRRDLNINTQDLVFDLKLNLGLFKVHKKFNFGEQDVFEFQFGRIPRYGLKVYAHNDPVKGIVSLLLAIGPGYLLSHWYLNRLKTKRDEYNKQYEENKKLGIENPKLKEVMYDQKKWERLKEELDNGFWIRNIIATKDAAILSTYGNLGDAIALIQSQTLSEIKTAANHTNNTVNKFLINPLQKFCDSFLLRKNSL